MIREEIESYLDYSSEFIKKIAEQALAIDNAYKSGEINKLEYEELLNDLIIQKNVSASLKDLAVKESLNKLLNNLILLAAAI